MRLNFRGERHTEILWPKFERVLNKIKSTDATDIETFYFSMNNPVLIFFLSFGIHADKVGSFFDSLYIPKDREYIKSGLLIES